MQTPSNTPYPRLLLWAVLALHAAVACTTQPNHPATQQQQDLRNYYYPFHDLSLGIVYEFRPIDNPSVPPYYLHLQSIVENAQKYILRTYYDNHVRILYQCREHLLNEGAIAEKYTLSEYTPQGEKLNIVAALVNNTLFPFRQVDTGAVARLDVRYISRRDPNEEIHIATQRKALGLEEIDIEGKKVQCLRIQGTSLKESNHKKEGFISAVIELTELYADGIGLVYVQNKVQGQPTAGVTYKLHKRYPTDVFFNTIKNDTLLTNPGYQEKIKKETSSIEGY